MKKTWKTKNSPALNITIYIIKIAILAILYHLAARLGLKMAYVQVNTSPVWPPTGIGLAVLLLFGINLWPGIAIGVLIGTLLTDTPPILALGMAFGNTLESFVGAYVLKKIFNFHNSIDRVKDVTNLTLVALLSTAISATIGTSTLMFTGRTSWGDFWNIWTTWWVGDLLGALVVAPVLLVWLTPTEDKYRKRFYKEGLILFVVAAFVSWYVFNYKPVAGVLHQALIYLIFPFMIWTALRLKQRGATIFIALVSGIAISGTIKSLGPFSMGTLNDSLVLLQTFMGVLALTSLILAATTIEREKTSNELNKSVTDLAMLNDSSREFLDNFDFGNIYRIISELAVKRLGFDVAWVEPMGLESQGEIQETVFGISYKSVEKLKSQWEENLSSSDFGETIVRISEDVGLVDGSLDNVYQSFISLPLIFSDEIIGIIKLLSKEKILLTKDQLQLTESFANLAAVAIQNTRLYDQVQQRNQQLHALSQRLLRAQEEERLHLSRELHDESGQLLAALSVQLGLLENHSDEQEIIDKRITEIKKTASDLQINLHRLAVDLRPASLDHLGLVNAIQQHADEFSRQHNIQVEFEAVSMEKVRLPIEVETALFRIVQESLTNIGLHAQASQVDVLISRNVDRVVVVVEDDGMGFILPSKFIDQQLGLFGMSERIEMLNGEFTIESATGKGTTIKAEVPYND